MNKLKPQTLWLRDEVGRVATIRLVYVGITNDLISGILLSQIVYWFKPSVQDGTSKLTIYREGRCWLAKRRASWEQEIGISPKQFDRACDLLASLGIIDRALFLYGKSPTVHISLNIDKLSKLVDSHILSKLPKGKNTNTPKVEMQFPQKGKTYSTKNTNNTDSTEISTSVTAKGKDMHSSEALEKLNIKIFPPYATTTGPRALEVWWRKMVPHFHDVGFMKVPTGKERGQFTKLHKVLGSDSAYVVTLWAVKNWGVFCVDVRKTKAQDTPELPHIGCLLANHEVAARGYLTSVQLIAKAKRLETSKQLTLAEAKLLVLGKL